MHLHAITLPRTFVTLIRTFHARLILVCVCVTVVLFVTHVYRYVLIGCLIYTFLVAHAFAARSVVCFDFDFTFAFVHTV